MLMSITYKARGSQTTSENEGKEQHKEYSFFLSKCIIWFRKKSYCIPCHTTGLSSKILVHCWCQQHWKIIPNKRNILSSTLKTKWVNLHWCSHREQKFILKKKKNALADASVRGKRRHELGYATTTNLFFPSVSLRVFLAIWNTLGFVTSTFVLLPVNFRWF